MIETVDSMKKILSEQVVDEIYAVTLTTFRIMESLRTRQVVGV